MLLTCRDHEGPYNECILKLYKVSAGLVFRGLLKEKAVLPARSINKTHGGVFTTCNAEWTRPFQIGNHVLDKTHVMARPTAVQPANLLEQC